MLFFIEIFKEFIKLVPMSFIMIYITSHLGTVANIRDLFL